MILTSEAAVARYERFAGIHKAPSLHPYYVQMDAQRDPSLEPHFFCYEEDGESYYHGFHRARIPNTPFFDIQSPYGYGGPLATTEDPDFLRRAASSYKAWCQDSNILAEFIRFHPILKNWRFYHGETFLDRETVWINLEVDYSKEYKKRLKSVLSSSARRGLQVEWDLLDRETFKAIYRARMEELRASSLYFFNDAYFSQAFNWERVHLALCHEQGTPIAAALFLVEDGAAEYHLAAATPLGLQLGAPSLILHEAAGWARTHGCRYLHLGGGTDRDPENRLLFFKAAFSNLRADFRIGAYVHDAEAYQTLKATWSSLYGEVPNRVLFYR